MKNLLSTLLLLTLWVIPSLGQTTSEQFLTDFERKFDYAAYRLVALAEETPEDLFSWMPMEGAMSMERVYLHIARYNYLYPERNMGITAPEEIDLEGMEDLTGKEAVLQHLTASIEYVKTLISDMDAPTLEQDTRMYGNSTENWGVLFQLITHMSEHTGQVIAYARMNDIVPPGTGKTLYVRLLRSLGFARALLSKTNPLTEYART